MIKGTFTSVPIKLSEDNDIEGITRRVQLLKTCTFYHERYGKVQITRQMFSEIIKNYEDQVRGIDVMIDYSHESDKTAAGWIKGLEEVEVQLSEGNPALGIEPVTEFQLWANVEWTPKGQKTLSDKEYAYLSADFDPDYRDNENPTQTYGAVLLGAGLTNRPVIKRMSPAVQLSEFSITNNEEPIMTVEEMTKLLDSKTIRLSEVEKELGEATKTLSDSEVKLAQIDTMMKEMGVSSIEELMTMIKDMSKDNVELAEAKEKAEKEAKLNVLLSEGKINQAQKESGMKLGKEAFEGFYALAETNEKVVKLSEEGNNTTPTEEVEREVETKVLELAEKKAVESKISMTDAISIVLSENKDLASKYYNLTE